MHRSPTNQFRSNAPLTAELPDATDSRPQIRSYTDIYKVHLLSDRDNRGNPEFAAPFESVISSLNQNRQYILIELLSKDKRTSMAESVPIGDIDLMCIVVLLYSSRDIEHEMNLK